MTLDELVKIQNAANHNEFVAKQKLIAAKEIGDHRNMVDRPLRDSLKMLTEYDSDGHKMNALKVAELALRADFFRIAELTLKDDARVLTAQAKALRAQVFAYCDKKPPEAA